MSECSVVWRWDGPRFSGYGIVFDSDSMRMGSFWAGGKLKTDMKPSFLQSVLLVVVLAFAASVCGAQTSGSESGSGQAKEDLHGLRVVQVPVRPLPTPFPLDARTGRVQELEFRAPEAMT